ncbi:MAG TPA: hypothetical protein VFO25_01290 [Candidatus Eremiobacteraceae bacterium]|nr:hypothetical protein [Candidatus Eremiobacteraceae bacterium]
MSSSLVITAADRTGRWYLVPGSSNSYDLTVANESDHAVLCKLTLDEPTDAGAVTPSSLTLKGGESRNVSVAFKPEWLTLRDRKAVVTARDAAGTVIATFVSDLVAATATDCSVSLAWKDEIGGDGGLRGFMLSCAVRSISSMPGVFEPEFTPHPSLHFPEKQRISLGPGESSTFDVPIIWNRSSRDPEGWNHPRSIEVAVPVTHGRRSATAPWDLVQHHIEPYLTDADKSPLIARRPPPPKFTQPGGAPAMSPLAATQLPEPLPAAPATGSHNARIEQAEMEAGVVASPRSAQPAGHDTHPAQPAQVPPSHARPVDRETIAISPSTLLLIALAVSAIAIALVWIMRTSPGTSAVSTAPVPIASKAIPSGPPVHRPKARPKKPSSHATTASVAGTVQNDSTTTVPSQGAATTSSATSAPQSHEPPAQTQRASAPRVSPLDRSALVQLGDVGAEYMRGGRQVHVFWSSYAQARAQIQLLDDRSTLVAQTVVGRREAALLSLPRNYRGSLYIQVTAIGYDGTRVVSTTSLGPP